VDGGVLFSWGSIDAREGGGGHSPKPTPTQQEGRRKEFSTPHLKGKKRMQQVKEEGGGGPKKKNLEGGRRA